MKLLFNLFCRDVDAQLAFYAGVLQVGELIEHRSPIYRSLAVGNAELGFNAWPAYALLGLPARAPAPGAGELPICGFATFQLDDAAAVDAAEKRISAAGGRIVKPAFATYYAQWQSVAADPERNVFRLASPTLPGGIRAPSFASLALGDALS